MLRLRQARRHNTTHGNNPQKKVLKVRKYYYFCNVSDPMIWNGHIDESVFALSFQENVVVFNEYKDKPTAPFICICLRVFYTQQYRCGDCSVYLLSGSTTTFLKISDETGSTLSFIVSIPIRSVGLY